MGDVPSNVEVLQARDVRNGFRDVMNVTVNKSQVTVVSRYSKPEGVLIPYDWMMQARNGDFVQLVHLIRKAVEEAAS